MDEKNKKFQHIDCHDTTHLFWNKYAYKVVIGLQNFISASKPQPITQFVRLIYQQHHEGYAIRQRILKRVKRFCPAAEKDWRYLKCGYSINFFFVNEAAAETFIEKTRKHVLAYYRPASSIHMETMSHDHKVKIRSSLFYNRFRWCITFRYIYESEEEELIDWIIEQFGTNKRSKSSKIVVNHRYYLSVGQIMRLYLITESDVIMTKLVHSHLMNRVEYIVLNSELEKITCEPNIDRTID